MSSSSPDQPSPSMDRKASLESIPGSYLVTDPAKFDWYAVLKKLCDIFAKRDVPRDKIWESPEWQHFEALIKEVGVVHIQKHVWSNIRIRLTSFKTQSMMWSMVDKLGRMVLTREEQEILVHGGSQSQVLEERQRIFWKAVEWMLVDAKEFALDKHQTLDPNDPALADLRKSFAYAMNQRKSFVHAMSVVLDQMLLPEVNSAEALDNLWSRALRQVATSQGLLSHKADSLDMLLEAGVPVIWQPTQIAEKGSKRIGEEPSPHPVQMRDATWDLGQRIAGFLEPLHDEKRLYALSALLHSEVIKAIPRESKDQQAWKWLALATSKNSQEKYEEEPSLTLMKAWMKEFSSLMQSPDHMLRAEQATRQILWWENQIRKGERKALDPNKAEQQQVRRLTWLVECAREGSLKVASNDEALYQEIFKEHPIGREHLLNQSFEASASNPKVQRSRF